MRQVLKNMLFQQANLFPAEIKIKPLKSTKKKALLKRSLNEQPEEEEEGEEIQWAEEEEATRPVFEVRYTVSAEKHVPSFQAETLVLEARKRVSLTEDACSPLCFVSSRITTMLEEEEDDERRWKRSECTACFCPLRRKQASGIFICIRLLQYPIPPWGEHDVHQQNAWKVDAACTHMRTELYVKMRDALPNSLQEGHVAPAANEKSTG